MGWLVIPGNMHPRFGLRLTDGNSAHPEKVIKGKQSFQYSFDNTKLWQPRLSFLVLKNCHFLSLVVCSTCEGSIRLDKLGRVRIVLIRLDL